MRKQVWILIIVFVVLAVDVFPSRVMAQGGGGKAYLPFGANGANIYEPTQGQQIVNVPYFPISEVISYKPDTEDKFYEMAVFWFGKVQSDTNYTDVRVGYNDEAL